MLGNIIDNRRRDHPTPECDVVFEPSCNTNLLYPDGSDWFDGEGLEDDPTFFNAREMIDTNVRDAILHAETEWTFAVTVFLYDKGTRPLTGPSEGRCANES